MPALLCQAEKPAFRHLRQMPAGSLRGHAGGVGELGRCKARPSSSAISTLARAGFPARAATSASDGWVACILAKIGSAHGVVIARYYGIDRSNRGGQWRRVAPPLRYVRHQRRRCSDVRRVLFALSPESSILAKSIFVSRAIMTGALSFCAICRRAARGITWCFTCTAAPFPQRSPSPIGSTGGPGAMSCAPPGSTARARRGPQSPARAGGPFHL